jgi:ABC-2 type transport system ATP-binding protein
VLTSKFFFLYSGHSMNKKDTKDINNLIKDKSYLPDKAVSTRGLEKIYKVKGNRDIHALRAFDLDVPRGVIFGLLGPNGAGKSTFINILAGLVLKTDGKASVWGIDIDKNPRAARSAIGVVPQELNLDAFFTPKELLELQAGLYGVPPIERHTEDILKRVGLIGVANTFSRELSGGMRRRLLVAKALVHNPPVLVLDEPTAGVDVELRQSLWEFIIELKNNGTTIILTTHYIEEAEQLCDIVAIINDGQLITSDPTEKLVARLDNKELRISISEKIKGIPSNLSKYHAVLNDKNELVFRYQTSKTEINSVLKAISEAGLTVNDISSKEPDLEQVFLDITRKSK